MIFWYFQEFFFKTQSKISEIFSEMNNDFSSFFSFLMG